jgi:two-component system, cell cycle sensor histidine kinase and response regulator CckA
MAACLAVVLMLHGQSTAQDGGPAERTYVVGITNDSFPYSYTGPDGTIKGFNIDILTAVMRSEHMKYRVVIAPGQQIISRFKAGEFDFMAELVEQSDFNTFAEFSVPTVTTSMGIIVRSSSGITQAEDLAGKTVAFVNKGSLGVSYLHDHNISFIPAFEINPLASLQAVAEGKADGTIIGRFTAQALIDVNHISGLRLIDISMAGYDLRRCFAVHRGDTSLLARLDDGFSNIQRNGDYQRIYAQWKGKYDTKRFTRSEVVDWGVAALVTAFIAALWGLVRQRRLHRALSAKTREISSQRALLQALYDHIPIGMTVVTANSSKPQVVLKNREAEGMSAETSTHLISEAMARRPPGSSEFQFDHTDPVSSRTYLVTVVPLTDSGRETGSLCVLSDDITERRRAEAEVAQSRKLRAVGELVGGIAHEFNNLLTPILLKTGELQMTSPSGRELEQELEVIAAAALRGAELTRRLLTFARTSDNHPENIDVARIVEGCFKLLSSTVDRRIVWENAVPSGLPPFWFNETDLNQILMNLLLNARDTLLEKLAMPHGADWEPRIRVGASQLPAEDFSTGQNVPEGSSLTGWLQLTVNDNGMGIPGNVKERMYEPFFTTKDVGKGTGLGLATIWHIVTAAGGNVRLESTPGQGTTFEVFLPAWSASTEAPLEMADNSPAPATGSLRVLLVEDDPLVSRAMMAVLSRSAHKVRLISDGREAARVLETDAGSFDLLVLDVNLPGYSGVELVSVAREHRTTAQILVMSGRVDESVRRTLEALGVSHFLTKPFAVEKFEAAVRACVAAGAAGAAGAALQRSS